MGAETAQHLLAHDGVAVGSDVIKIARRGQGTATTLAPGRLESVQDGAAEAHLPVVRAFDIIDGRRGAGLGTGAASDTALSGPLVVAEQPLRGADLGELQGMDLHGVSTDPLTGAATDAGVATQAAPSLAPGFLRGVIQFHPVEVVSPLLLVQEGDGHPLVGNFVCGRDGQEVDPGAFLAA